MNSIANATEGYSGSDITALCRDAAFGPIRELGTNVSQVAKADVRPISYKDFENSLRQIRASVSQESLKAYELWNKEFGSSAM